MRAPCMVLWQPECRWPKKDQLTVRLLTKDKCDTWIFTFLTFLCGDKNNPIAQSTFFSQYRPLTSEPRSYGSLCRKCTSQGPLKASHQISPDGGGDRASGQDTIQVFPCFSLRTFKFATFIQSDQQSLVFGTISHVPRVLQK